MWRQPDLHIKMDYDAASAQSSSCYYSQASLESTSALHFPFPLFTLSHNGGIIEWNQAMKDLTGYSAHEVKGKVIADNFLLASEEHVEPWEDCYQSVLVDGKTRSCVVDIRPKLTDNSPGYTFNYGYDNYASNNSNSSQMMTNSFSAQAASNHYSTDNSNDHRQQAVKSCRILVKAVTHQNGYNVSVKDATTLPSLWCLLEELEAEESDVYDMPVRHIGSNIALNYADRNANDGNSTANNNGGRKRSLLTRPYDEGRVRVNLNYLHIPTLFVDKEYNIVVCNEKMTDLILKDKGDSKLLIGSSVQKICATSQDWKTIRTMIAASFSGQEGQTDLSLRSLNLGTSLRRLHMQQNQSDQSTQAIPVSIATSCQSENGVTLFIHDLSSEQAVRHHLTLYQESIQRSSSAVVIVSSRSGKIKEMNFTAEQLLTCSSSDYVGQNFCNAFIPSPQSTMEFESKLQQGYSDIFQLALRSATGTNVYSFACLSSLGSNCMLILTPVTEYVLRERRLAYTAKELRQVLDTMSSPMFGTDLNGRINEWNERTVEVMGGYTRDEVFGEDLARKFVSRSSREVVATAIQYAISGRATTNVDIEMTAKSHDITLLLATVTCRRDAVGNIVGAIFLAHDITELSKYDRAVAAMAGELRQLIDTANAPIFGIDREGDVNEWNEKIAEITGYSKEEAFDTSLVDNYIAFHDRTVARDVLHAALEGRSASNCDLEFVTRNNQICHFLVNATTRRDADGNVVGVVGVAQDVTEAVKRDRAVAGIALELRQLIETANAPIFGIDVNGNVNEWNRMSEKITGYTKDEALHKPLVECFIAAHMQYRVQSVLTSALNGKETSNYELEIVTKSGESRFLLLNATTRRDFEASVVGVVGVAQDVTEDRKHSQELRRMQYLQATQEAKIETEKNMTSYFAHELRNPLGAIDCALHAMPTNLPEEARSLVTGMQLCSSFMTTIMNNLLDVRKMEEGKMILHKKPTHVCSLLKKTHRMLVPSVKADVSFTYQCQMNKKDQWILADEHRLQQVLTNVISNAVKYTLHGSIIIRASREGDQVKFECIDTGPGIPIKEQEKLFQRFVQRGGAPGTGLGLAIAKNLVELSGGSIKFVSDPSVAPGTTCIVYLPIEFCIAPGISTDMKDDESSALLQEPLRFLIIDDVKMNRVMLKKRIQRSIAPNCTVTEAVTGEEALQVCGKEKFDVIIVDQFMEEAGGVMVGTDVVYAMRRMRISSLIIGCSGNDLRDEFTEAGADWTWQKPIPDNKTISQYLRNRLSLR